ncbi:MAG: dUTP diphosphatase [Pseudomonadota bacterium]
MTGPIVMPPPPVEVLPLPHARHWGDKILPRYQSPGAAGADLVSAIETAVPIDAGERTLVGCGFAMKIPQGWEGQIRPRSGLALKHGITVLNAPGTIDSDYRGEVKVLLINHSNAAFVIEPLMRIAQLVFARVERHELRVVDTLPESDRGSGGFGSTGT